MDWEQLVINNELAKKHRKREKQRFNAIENIYIEWKIYNEFDLDDGILMMWIKKRE